MQLVPVSGLSTGIATPGVGATCDRVCGVEKYSSNGNTSTSCTPWDTCEAGERVIGTADAANNRLCSDCSGDYYSENTNSAVCSNCVTENNSYWTANSNNTGCVADTSQDGDGDGIASAHDECPDMPHYDYCGDPNVDGQTASFALSDRPVLSGASTITSLVEGKLHMWGGMRDVGDVSWHKVNINTNVSEVYDGTGVRRSANFYVRFFSGTGHSNTNYQLAVFTPQSNSGGGAGGGIGCPGTGSDQDNVFGNAYLNSGSSSDQEQVCTRHGGAAWDTGADLGKYKWEFGDTSVNAGYAGDAGQDNTRFSSSDRLMFWMDDSTASYHPYPGTYSGSNVERYVMVRITKVSGGGTCHPYRLAADLDTQVPHEASGAPSCADDAYGYCWNDVGGKCETSDGGGYECDFSCSAMADLFGNYSIEMIVMTYGVCW